MVGDKDGSGYKKDHDSVVEVLVRIVKVMVVIEHPRKYHSIHERKENNAYAKFEGDKQRALWYVMVFSGVVNNAVVAMVIQSVE